MNDFSRLNLSPALLQAVAALGYETMTEIQAAALPHLLQGHDALAQAPTGSGKTAAFALALLSQLRGEETRLQSLVLCPTRELAEQVSREIRSLACFVPNIKVLTLCGGTPVRAQLASLAHEPHIVVGTPGRIEDLIERKALAFDSLRNVVLDEADRMLDMGFVDAIKGILEKTPGNRNTWLFSATWPEEIRAISQQFQREPVAITLASQHDESVIEQSFYQVETPDKLAAVQLLLREYQPASCLIFCNTRLATRELCDALWKQRVPTIALHGELEQRERDEALLRFANGSCRVLVATDVAARGLDIKSLPMVIAFEVANDADMHLHRVGRTGRAGESGRALSLVAAREMPRLRRIAQAQQTEIEWTPLPTRPREAALPLPAMKTLIFDAGRQGKLRAGDILGALTGSGGLQGAQVGRIDVFPTRSYVAVEQGCAEKVLGKLRDARIKGRSIRVRAL